MATTPAEQERGSIFEPVPFDVDADVSEEFDMFGVDQARLRSVRRRRVAFGLLVTVGAVVAVDLALRHQRGLPAAEVSSAQMKAEKKKSAIPGVPPFKKCGGKSDYAGETCCQKGCACVRQSRYFAQCAAPGGGMVCSVEKAHGEVITAKEKAMEAKPAAEGAEKEAKLAEEAEKAAKEDLAKAEAVLDGLEVEGKAVRHQKDAAEHHVAEAKRRAKDADKAAESKQKHYEAVKREIRDINATNKLRSHGQCRGLYGECGPVAPPKLTKYMACCQPGCICKWRDDYYAQCQNPSGMGGCDPVGEANHIRERTSLMKKLQREHNELEKKRKEAHKVAVEMDEHAEPIRHKAAKVGTRRVSARTAMEQKKSIARSKTEDARRKRMEANHAAHTVHYTEKAVKAWEQASADDCKGEKEHKMEMDVRKLAKQP